MESHVPDVTWQNGGRKETGKARKISKFVGLICQIDLSFETGVNAKNLKMWRPET